MKVLAGLVGTVLALTVAVPAMARDQYVIDNAHLFSASTVSSLNQKIADFNAQTGKEVVVDTEGTLGGRSPANAEERTFAQQQVNGVLIFVAKSPKTIAVVPDRAGRQFFPAGETASIRDAIRAGFNSGDYDGGITNGVNLTLGQYRSHLGSLRTHANETVPASGSRSSANTGGFPMSFLFLILIAVVGFLILRAIFRAMAGPRMYPPGPGGPMGPGMGYGPGPGYGPGYGYGGGGGGFWSGLLGGLGGAFLGNELFGRGGGFGGNEIGGGTAAGIGGDTYTQQDATGWQSDAGQADMSNASSGGWGDSGGFDSGGGGGFDAGGGDFGGGGGDSGGGW